MMKIKIQQLLIKLKNNVIKYYKTSAFLCGCALSAALPPLYQFYMAILAVSGLVFLMCQFSEKKKLVAIGYWFGFGYFACGLYWIGNALLVDALETGWLYPIVLCLNGAFFGLYTIIPVLVAGNKYFQNPEMKIVIFASLWGMITEWIRGFLFTGFPWNPLSSILAFNREMLQPLSVFGTYGLSIILLIILAQGSLFFLQSNKKNLLISLFGMFVPLLILYSYGYYTINNNENSPVAENIKVRLVQPSISQQMKWDAQLLEDNLQQYIDLSTRNDNSDVDFVVWGETASPYDLTFDNAHRLAVTKAIPNRGYLLTGILRYGYGNDGYKLYNSFSAINVSGDILDLYDKNHLVPFGEYMPLRKYLPDWIKPVTNMVGQFGRGFKYQTIKVGNFPEFAPLICYEIIFSGEVVRKNNKPKWAVVLTNDGWYGLSNGPYQHLVSAQMRAVEEGISIVRSANSGISAVISPYGKIIDSLGLHQKGYFDAVVPLGLAHNTLFGKFGNYIPLLLSALLLLFAVIISRKKPQN